MSDVNFLLSYVVGLYLFVVPGFWMVPLLRSAGFRRRERIAMAVSMGPVLVGLIMLVARACGIAARPASLIIAVLSLPALVFATIELRSRSQKPWYQLGPSAIVAMLLPMVWVVAFWVVLPGFRIFNWHALMQIDICNALARGMLPPEEPEMAGLVCSYSWFVNLFWVAQSSLTGLSPTIFVAGNNLVALAAQVVLGFVLGRRSGLTRPMAWLSTGLILFGSGMPALVADALGLSVPSEPRVTPLMAKYVTLDAMPFAFPLLTGLLIFCVRRGKVVARDAVALFLLSASLGLVYPVLLPAAACVVGAWFIRLLPRLDCGRATLLRLALLLPILAVAFGLSAIVTASFIKLVSVDRSGGSVVALSMPDHWVIKFVKLTVAIGWVIPLGCMALIRRRDFTRRLWWRVAFVGVILVAASGSMIFVARVPKRVALIWTCCSAIALLITALALRRRRHPVAMEWIVGLGCLFCYLCFGITDLEYKFVLAASIALMPVAAFGLQAFLRRVPLACQTVSLALPVFLAGLTLHGGLARGIHVPKSLATAPKVEERCVPMELAPSQPEWAWVSCVSRDSPGDAVVVSHGDLIHVAAFVDRAMYIPSGQGDGQEVAGYSLPTQLNMTGFRGHSKSVYNRRAEAVRWLYEESLLREEAVVEISQLGRPVAVHLGSGDRELRDWLRKEQVGRPLLETKDDSVWLIPAPGSRSEERNERRISSLSKRQSESDPRP